MWALSLLQAGASVNLQALQNLISTAMAVKTTHAVAGINSDRQREEGRQKHSNDLYFK